MRASAPTHCEGNGCRGRCPHRPACPGLQALEHPGLLVEGGDQLIQGGGLPVHVVPGTAVPEVVELVHVAALLLHPGVVFQIVHPLTANYPLAGKEPFEYAAGFQPDCPLLFRADKRIPAGLSTDESAMH